MILGMVSRRISHVLGSVNRCSNKIVKKNFSKLAENDQTFMNKHLGQQLDHFNELIENSTKASLNWCEVKESILSKDGVVNETNINAILLKKMISLKKLDSALSFAEYLKKNINGLNLGTINGLLRLYFVIALQNKLSDIDRKFILDVCKSLREKYKTLDYTTYEQLIHALCIIDEWKICLELLDEIKQSDKPTNSIYSTLIATLFRNHENEAARKIMRECIDNGRNILDYAYVEWINYIFRKSNDKITITKHLNEINECFTNNCITITQVFSEKLKHTYESLGWSVNHTRIERHNGQCKNCNERLNFIALTTEEFRLLQRNVKEKLIIGSDLFLKSSPHELEKFQKFINLSGPFDVVLDALNIAYSARGLSPTQRMDILIKVADYFVARDKHVLLLGRKHMQNWSKSLMSVLLEKTSCFFADNLSQDDPYLITAAILSGPGTDIVSRDMMRSHKFVLRDDRLQKIFMRWQLQHQWMIMSTIKGPLIKQPLTFTPFAQKINGAWHIPVENKSGQTKIFNDWVPDLHSWLCIRPPSI